MKNKSIYIILLCMIFSFLLAGCGADGTKEKVSQAESKPAPSGLSGQEKTEAGKKTEEGEDMPVYSYTTQELWVQNGDMKIYGISYVPDRNEAVPLVIFSHELGNDHTSGERYAERLAQAGYAAYIFDFCGGTVGGNKSDGSNKEMSVLTEASDLEAVLSSAKTWDFVDPDRIFLLGGSMGGLVTTIVGSEHQDEIAGMMLMYPALSAKADSGEEDYGEEEEIPEDVSLFGGWIHVGRKYITDLRMVDFNQLLSSYKGHMLLLHGDKDNTVPLSWSEEAKEMIPDCDFHVIEDGGHEFFGQPFEDAMSYIMDYLDTQLNHGAEKEDSGDAQGESGKRKKAVEDSGDAQMESGKRRETAEDGKEMKMSVNGTEVEVAWEDNASVDALRELAAKGLEIRMSMYGGFEQVGRIGQDIPAKDEQITTEAGDIVLYSGNQFVVFYGSNSWAYTRLGHITDQTAEELEELLGNGGVTITISRV